MVTDFDEPEWEEALARSKAEASRTFKAFFNRVFWREYDLQSYMYGRMFEDPVLQPYVRREHRIWYEDKRKQLLVLDLALLDPQAANSEYPYWPVREMIQLKFPVEFETGLTEPDDLKPEKVALSPKYYLRRCRTRIRRKIWEDHLKFKKAVAEARNTSVSARCHIMYFDLADRPSYSSSEEMVKDLSDTKHVDMTRIGSWPLILTYEYAYPQGETESM